MLKFYFLFLEQLITQA